MAISKSTPYVRYKKDFTSSLHLGTIHIESEYLDRTQKTTIESIHGMTWHNKVVNENKELNLLSDTQLELTELEKQYWNTGEKRVSVDEIHTLEEVEPNEDGTYTYTVNSMEGEYIEIYDGINNITSTSDGLDGQFEIVYDTTEEDINGNIALDQVVSQYEITDSGVGTITSAKSTGLTLVNHITEPSKEEVVAIEQQEGKHFTIENTVRGNIKSAILSGNTLVNLCDKTKSVISEAGNKNLWRNALFNTNPTRLTVINYTDKVIKYTVHKRTNDGWVSTNGVNPNSKLLVNCGTDKYLKDLYGAYGDGWSNTEEDRNILKDGVLILEGDHTQEDIPYFEGMQSVKMPVLTTTGKNLCDTSKYIHGGLSINNMIFSKDRFRSYYIECKPSTTYIISVENSNNRFGVGSSHLFSENTPFELNAYKNNNTDDDLTGQSLQFTLTTTEKDKYLYVYVANNGVFNPDIKVQIEESSTATSYEPHKSNILTVNEPVELRGIGDVQDTLDLMTGEVVQNIYEFILDGSQDIDNDGNLLYYYLPLGVHNNRSNSDKLPSITMGQILDGLTGVAPQNRGNASRVYINVNGITTKEEMKDFFLNNPTTIQLILTTPTVKTVDLTVQNQDGGTIPHIQTQQGITHVSTSSDGLSPVVEMSCSYDTIIKPNTTYTIKLDRPIVSDTMYLQVDLGGTMMMLDADVNAFTIKTPSTLSHSQLRLSGTGNTVKEIIVLEGNRVNDKIEYFEGMKNVENPILIVSNCPYVFGKGGRI